MTRYIQKLSIVPGREKWLGWEIDGIGSEIAGLQIADHLSDDELRAKGIKRFVPMSFESFLGMSALTAARGDWLDEEDLGFRFDALQVAIHRLHMQGIRQVPRGFIEEMFGPRVFADRRIEKRFREWEQSGFVERVGEDACYLRILKQDL